GFIPAILLLAFFSLGGVLLFYNLSAYLIRSEFRELIVRADAVATTAAVEIERGGGRDVSTILKRREVAADPELPGVSRALVPSDRPCAARASAATSAAGWAPRALPSAGPWTHLMPPSRL